MTTRRKPRSQPYRINWPANVKISPELQKALGQQFANIDECLQLIFSLLREDSDTANRNAAASRTDQIVTMMLGNDGEPGEPGLDGAKGDVGPAGPAGPMWIALDGEPGADGMDAMPSSSSGSGISAAHALGLALAN